MEKTTLDVRQNTSNLDALRYDDLMKRLDALYIQVSSQNLDKKVHVEKMRELYGLVNVFQMEYYVHFSEDSRSALNKLSLEARQKVNQVLVKENPTDENLLMVNFELIQDAEQSLFNYIQELIAAIKTANYGGV